VEADFGVKTDLTDELILHAIRAVAIRSQSQEVTSHYPGPVKLGARRAGRPPKGKVYKPSLPVGPGQILSGGAGQGHVSPLPEPAAKAPSMSSASSASPVPAFQTGQPSENVAAARDGKENAKATNGVKLPTPAVRPCHFCGKPSIIEANTRQGWIILTCEDDRCPGAWLDSNQAVRCEIRELAYLCHICGEVMSCWKGGNIFHCTGRTMGIRCDTWRNISGMLGPSTILTPFSEKLSNFAWYRRLDDQVKAHKP
jgi:hypothetical protein